MKKQFFVKLLIGFLAAILLLPIAYNAWAERGYEELDPQIQVQETQVQAVLPDDLQWRDNSEISGVQSAIAVGDLSKSELYVLFGRMNEGAIFPAHTHPDDRITTVISGVMYYGVGEQLDDTTMQPYAVGSVVYTPAGVPHFMWVQDGETVMQETGFGPTGLSFIANTR